MDLARLAAIGVIENLRPIDLVGVLIFDNSFQWAVPIRRATDRETIKRLVAGITPDGGTQIAPAVTEAYKKILPMSAVSKRALGSAFQTFQFRCHRRSRQSSASTNEQVLLSSTPTLSRW